MRAERALKRAGSRLLFGKTRPKGLRGIAVLLMKVGFASVILFAFALCLRPWGFKGGTALAVYPLVAFHNMGVVGAFALPSKIPSARPRTIN